MEDASAAASDEVLAIANGQTREQARVRLGSAEEHLAIAARKYRNVSDYAKYARADIAVRTWHLVIEWMAATDRDVFDLAAYQAWCDASPIRWWHLLLPASVRRRRSARRR